MINAITVSNHVRELSLHPVGFISVTFMRDNNQRCKTYYEPTASSLRRVIRAQARHIYAVLTAGEMNDHEINLLISARDRLTNRRDECLDYAAIDNIDSLLSTCEPGRRNDVDLLLGRMCATLPDRDALTARHEAALAPQPHIDYAVDECMCHYCQQHTVEAMRTRCMLVALNDDQGMMGDHD